MTHIRPVRAIVTGLAGGLAWIVAMLAFFGPAQTILANPDYQSEKFIAVFSTIEPLPHATENIWVLVIGLMSIGIIYGLIFAWLSPGLPGKGWRKGAAFGLTAWALSFTWFEFYLPWNVMWEPPLLVLLELALWFLVMQAVGIVMSIVYQFRTK